jgi:hypothetical protein
MFGVFSFVCLKTNKTKYSKHASERRLEKQTKLNTPSRVFSFVCFLRRRSLVCLEYLVLFVF